LLIPFLLWAAIRFGLLEASLAVLLVAGIAISSVRAGPFPTDEVFLMLQVFMGVVGVMTTMVACVVAQHEQIESVLRGARDEMADRVQVTGEALTGAVKEIKRSDTLLARAQQIAHTGSFE